AKVNEPARSRLFIGFFYRRLLQAPLHRSDFHRRLGDWVGRQESALLYPGDPNLPKRQLKTHTVSNLNGTGRVEAFNSHVFPHFGSNPTDQHRRICQRLEALVSLLPVWTRNGARERNRPRLPTQVIGDFLTVLNCVLRHGIAVAYPLLPGRVNEDVT